MRSVTAKKDNTLQQCGKRGVCDIISRAYLDDSKIRPVIFLLIRQVFHTFLKNLNLYWPISMM